MKSLWFKKCYVQSILNGAKTDTIRKNSSRLPLIHDEFYLSVGPRKPFATAIIIKKNIIDMSQIDDDRKKQLQAIYPDYLEKFVCLTFKLKTTC